MRLIVFSFRVLESDHRYYQDKARLRSDYVGWLGLGGAVMQWHPELNIGFAFTTDLVAWHDGTNSSAARLQAEAAKCARRARD